VQAELLCQKVPRPAPGEAVLLWVDTERLSKEIEAMPTWPITWMNGNQDHPPHAGRVLGTSDSTPLAYSFALETHDRVQLDDVVTWSARRAQRCRE